MNKHFCRKFTIIEVVAALTILTTAVSALLALTLSAQQRIVKNHEAQQHFHMLQQAVEFYMLQPNEPSMIPDTIFSYPGYQAKCIIEPSDAMIEELNDSNSLIQLDVWRISIINTATNEVVESINIERFNYE